jgi:hypothetical protein
MDPRHDTRELINTDIQALIRLKEQGIGRVIRIADGAQASDIKQLNDSGIVITAVDKVPGTNKQNWDEWRASLMEQQGAFNRSQGNPSSLSHPSSPTSMTIP